MWKTKSVLKETFRKAWRGVASPKHFLCISSDLYALAPKGTGDEICAVASLEGDLVWGSHTPVTDKLREFLSDEDLEKIKEKIASGKDFHLHILLPPETESAVGYDALYNALEDFAVNGYTDGKVEIVNVGVCWEDYKNNAPARYWDRLGET